jgi:hypothetical protein
MKCYEFQGGGLCSECKVDADCQEGGGPGSCTLSFATGYATCTDGSRGSGCEETSSCADGLFCASLIEGATYSYCSDCATDDDCMGGQLCTPFLNDGDIGGYKYCVDPGSIDNDAACPTLDMVGLDEACASGFCGEVELMSGLVLALCGECDDDGDCGSGMSCAAPMLGFTMRQGATCVEGTGTGESGGSETGAGDAGTTGSGGTTGTTG